MKFNSLIENYPSPVIAIDNENFVCAKNYLSSMSFPNVHVGAKVSNYTDINIAGETLSKGLFYGKEVTYFICNGIVENEPCKLLFISLCSFGKTLLPFNPVELYKNNLTKDGSNYSDKDKNKQRKYIRSIHKNLLKVNYFDNFRALFEGNARPIDENDKTDISSFSIALQQVLKNHLEEINFTFKNDFSPERLIATISKIDLASLLLNSLSFCIINSSDDIEITFNNNDDFAQIKMNFYSDTDIFELYKIKETDIKNNLINSGFALCIALEISKQNKISFSLEKEVAKNKFVYSVKHIIPIETKHELLFSSQTSTTRIIEDELFDIFFDTAI